MPNHFHLLIQQCKDIPTSQLLLRLCTSYGKYFNKKYDRVGSLFQDQSKAVQVITDEQLLWLSAYIHANPLTAHLVTNLNMWPWSSWPEYAGLRKGEIVNMQLILSFFLNKSSREYSDFFFKAAPLIIDRKSIKHLLLD